MEEEGELEMQIILLEYKYRKELQAENQKERLRIQVRQSIKDEFSLWRSNTISNLKQYGILGVPIYLASIVLFRSAFILPAMTTTASYFLYRYGLP